MTLQRKLELGFVCLLSIGVVLGVVAYVHEREDKLVAEARMKQRSEDADKQVSDLKAQAKQVDTPEKAGRALQKVLPNNVHTHQVTKEDVARIAAQRAQGAEKSNQASAPLPDAPAPQTLNTAGVPEKTISAMPLVTYPTDEGWRPQVGDVVIPKDDTIPFYQNENQCDQDHIELRACQKNLKDAKGEASGGFWARLRRGAKHSLCGATGGGAAVAIGTQTKNPTMTLVGGIGLFVGCEALLR